MYYTVVEGGGPTMSYYLRIIPQDDAPASIKVDCISLDKRKEYKIAFHISIITIIILIKEKRNVNPYKRKKKRKNPNHPNLERYNVTGPIQNLASKREREEICYFIL
jgi:hypothetical protein